MASNLASDTDDLKIRLVVQEIRGVGNKNSPPHSLLIQKCPSPARVKEARKPTDTYRLTKILLLNRFLGTYLLSKRKTNVRQSSVR